MKKTLLFSITVTLLINVFQLHAQTFVSGGIFSNTTWTLSNAPYIVTDDVVVFDNVTLTIESGVVVKFYQNKGIDLRGNLIAIGTLNDSITFTLDTIQSGVTWSGIILGPAANLTVDLTYAKVTYSNIFLDCDVATGTIQLNNSVFENNYKVIYEYAGASISIDSCLFRYNTYGVERHRGTIIKNSTFEDNQYGLSEVNYLNVTNCRFNNNSEAGISCQNTWTGTIKNCVFTNNNIGLEFAVSNGSNQDTITGNIISCNNIGFKIYYCWWPSDITGNTFSDNTQYDVYNASSNNCDLPNNCWGTTNSDSINANIYDGNDDLSLGLIIYNPLDSNCSVINCDSFVTKITDNHSKINTTLLAFSPNPFNENINIRYQVTQTGHTFLSIVDINGKTVETLVNRHLSKGTYMSNYRRGNINNGIYFLLLKNGTTVSYKKLVLIQ